MVNIESKIDLADVLSETCKTFQVPFTHRVFFTKNLIADDHSTLFNLFEASGNERPRVQVWIDESVVIGQRDLISRVSELFDMHNSAVILTGVHVCTGGEEVKNDWRHVELMLAAMNRENLDRRSYIVVIGGGAVLDAVGFAAATAHRGIRLIRVPTTTLSQADSGIGVKNAVNRFGKKNWLGCFAVPWAVLNDSALLTTLPIREFRAGFSEAVKVALLKSRSGFEELERAASDIGTRVSEPSERAIKLSADLHLLHITEGGDPFEALQARPLDFGHWSAHRIESMTNFTVPHGEAVAIGVAIDSVYSSLVHGFPVSDAGRVLKTLSNLRLPLFHQALEKRDQLFEGLEEFRQHLGGNLTLTMLRAIGEPIETHSIDCEKMQLAIDTVYNFSVTATSNCEMNCAA